MIPADLLTLLACPACKTPLTQVGEGLKCAQCGRVFPIRDGLPILLLDEAVTDPS